MDFSIRKAVMAIIINKQGKVLIGSSPRDGGYKFPQGGLEPNEDCITGIKRELKEELDIIITDNDIIHAYSEKVAYTYPKEEKYIFTGQELNIVTIRYNSSMQLNPQDDEFEVLYWIFPKELYKYNTFFRTDAYNNALRICRLI